MRKLKYVIRSELSQKNIIRSELSQKNIILLYGTPCNQFYFIQHNILLLNMLQGVRYLKKLL